MTPLLLLLSAVTPEIMPADLLYQPYFGSPKEARIADIKFWEPDRGWLWDITLGGRAGAVRLDLDPLVLQLDVEGAAFVRLDLDDNRDLLSTEFKYGIWMSARIFGFGARFGWYHLSAHLGDETFPDRTPNGYSRDVFLLGLSFRTAAGIRLYSEAEVGFVVNGPAQRLHLHLGGEWSPAVPDAWGRPYAALHGWLRQENRFVPLVTLQAGWQWRPSVLGRSYRIGAYFSSGPSPHYQFFEETEHQIGIGNWFEF